MSRLPLPLWEGVGGRGACRFDRNEVRDVRRTTLAGDVATIAQVAWRRLPGLVSAANAGTDDGRLCAQR
jgi:hypothetical protein